MIPFVDAHVHLWDLAHIRYPWLTPPFRADRPGGSTAAIAADYSLDDYLAEAAAWNVQGMVHVEAGADPADALKETRWLQAIANARGLPQAIVACAALDDPALDAHLAAQAANPNLRGIRHIANWHADPALTYTPRDVTRDEAWQAGYARLKHYGLSFDCQIYPGQAPAIARLAERHPETPLILDHLMMPVLADGLAVWRDGLKLLAALPHAHIKLSGAGFIRRPFDAGTARPFLLTAIEHFGTGRCLVASDFPTDRLFGGFDAHLAAYHDILSGFSEAERRDLFARNATRVYRMALEV